MAHDVTLHPLARADLFDLYTYIEAQSGPARASGYVDRIEAICANLSSLPHRGTDRGDLGLGVRTLSLERRLLIAYRLDKDRVEILRVMYAGRDFTVEDFPC